MTGNEFFDEIHLLPCHRTHTPDRLQAFGDGRYELLYALVVELNAFFKEQSLLDQDFFNAAKFKGSIQQLLKQNNVMLEKYVRIEVGHFFLDEVEQRRPDQIAKGPCAGRERLMTDLALRLGVLCHDRE